MINKLQKGLERLLGVPITSMYQKLLWVLSGMLLLKLHIYPISEVS